MGLNSFDRNWGGMQHSREYWGGNNGFVTIVFKLPADLDFGVIGEDFTSTDADELATAKTYAERNLTKVVEAIAMRGVLVTTSQLLVIDDVAELKTAIETVGDNVLAFHKEGTLEGKCFAVTFEVERANVFDTQLNKPGSTYAIDIKPTEDMAKGFLQDGVFSTRDGKKAPAFEAVVVKVFDALPPILV